MDNVNILVNGEEYKLDSEEVKVARLIVLGGHVDSENYELQRRKALGGPVDTTYTDLEEIIKIRDGDVFTTRYTGSINPA